MRPDTGWCAKGGGCDAVRLSNYSHIYGIPVPVFGVIFFAGLFGPILSQRMRVLLPMGSALGALFAVRLNYIMAFVLHAYCPFCVMVDASSLALAALALYSARRNHRKHESPSLALSSFTTALAAFLPFAYGLASGEVTAATVSPTSVVKTADTADMLPKPIAQEQRPGVVTIVEFSDFECPYCRAQHLLFTDLLPQYGDKVRVVRKHLPLVGLHEGADIAARSACCAEEEGRGEEMADALYQAEVLNADVCAALAQSLGLNLSDFGSCIKSDRTSKRLLYDRQDAEACKVEGLPTFWIGTERFNGKVGDAEPLRASIERALRQSQGG
jgi:uncharacterized membrane protein/protein-disulfide isomerase